MESAIYNLYSGQSGGMFPVYAGSRGGGGFFSSIAKFALPLLKNLGKRFLGVVSRGATQYLSGNKNLSTAMMDEMETEASDLAQVGLKRFNDYRKRRRGKGRKLLINKKSRLD